jgi:rod shape-determining protein MreC
MESLLNRYRNITVLLLVIFAQLVLLAVQVKNDQDVQLIRVWAVTAVTPVARIVEGLRGGSSGFLHNYILLHDTNAENRRLQAELDRLKLDNIFLKSELNRADRAKALEVFQQHTASKTVAATIFAVGAGSGSKVVFVDRGTVSGVQRGMAVVTPDGIVGKVTAAYPMSSAVQLITDADFAAGVVSQKNQAHGTLKGQGTPMCKVEYVPFEEKIEPGDMLYTSGDDRIFPRGFPVGVVKVVRPAQPFKEILVEPGGLQRGLEDVLILVQGVHQEIPDTPPVSQPVYIAPAPPIASGTEGQPPDAASTAASTAASSAGTASSGASPGTEADKLRSIYKATGEAQKHTFGEGLPGSKPPDFTKLPPGGTVSPSPNPGPPAVKSPDAGRRGSQAAGVPPGGPPR